MPKLLPEEVQIAMVNTYLTGETLARSAAKYGHCASACLCALKRRNIKSRKYKASIERQLTIIELYENGTTVEDLAIKFKLGARTIYRILNLHKIPRLGKAIPAVQRNIIIKEYLQGASIEAVASKCGYSRNGCWQVLKQAGIPRRSHSVILKAKWKDANQRINMSNAIRKFCSTPETKLRRSIAMSAKWKNPDIRKRTMDSRKILFSNPDYLAKKSESMREVWKKLSPEQRALWMHKTHIGQSDPAVRKRMSDTHKKMCMDGKSPSHGKRCTTLKGDLVRSGYEQTICNWLYSHDIDYQYEPRAFDFKKFVYTPDIYVPAWNCYIEVKGWWHKRDGKHPSDLEKFNAYLERYGNIILMEKDSVLSFRAN